MFSNVKNLPLAPQYRKRLLQISTVTARNIHNHACATCNDKRSSSLMGFETWDGWLLVTHTILLSSKINWYFLLIYILRLYCFFLNLSTHFPNTTKEFFRLLENISNNPLPASHPKDRVVNVCKHKFACTNVTPKRRNGAHFITHAPHCAWVIMFCRNKFRIRGQERLLASPKGGYHLTQTWN